MSRMSGIAEGNPAGTRTSSITFAGFLPGLEPQLRNLREVPIALHADRGRNSARGTARAR
jgi:hypothetical protein